MTSKDISTWYQIMVTEMRLSPSLHYQSMDTIIEDNIDFWYDSLNDCYSYKVDFELIGLYIDAITEWDTELW